MGVRIEPVTTASGLPRVLVSVLMATAVMAPLMTACGGGSSPSMTITPTPPPPPPPPPTITSSTRFDGGSPAPPAGAVLALTQFAFKTPRTGTPTLDTTVTNGGASTTVTDWPSHTYQVKIPGLGVDVSSVGNVVQVDSGHWLVVTYPNQPAWPYMLLGYWMYSSSAPLRGSPSPPDNVGVFVTGASTAASALPTTGTATYVGQDPSSIGIVGAATGKAWGAGETLINVNFATGGITGSISNVTNASAFANVGLTGSLSAASLSGTTAVTFTTDPTQISTAATGRFTGGLYGPTGQNLGMTWYASDANNTIGGVTGAGLGTPGARGFQHAPMDALTGTVFVPPAQASYAVSGTSLTASPANTIAQLTLRDPGYRNSIFGVTGSPAPDYVNPTFQLDIPALSISVPITYVRGGVSPLPSNYPTPLLGTAQSGSTWVFFGGGEMNYAVFGAWATSTQASGAPLTGFGPFVAGYQTTAAQMPTTGTATYTASAQGDFGPVRAILSSPGFSTSLLGTSDNGAAVSFTANFGTGAVTGSLTVPVTVNGATSSSGSFQVGMNGSITSNAFAGTTAVTSSTGSFMTTAATGSFKGGFFGPNVDEIAGVFDVSDGTNKAVGSFGAPKTH
jgi:hypothetical protein